MRTSAVLNPVHCWKLKEYRSKESRMSQLYAVVLIVIADALLSVQLRFVLLRWPSLASSSRAAMCRR
jgi:hypothetical protein